MCGPGSPWQELLCDECFGKGQEGLLEEPEDLCDDCREREAKTCPGCALLQEDPLEPGELCESCQKDFNNESHQKLEAFHEECSPLSEEEIR